MKVALLAALSGLTFAALAAELNLATPSASEYPDTESSVNVAVTNWPALGRRVKLTLSADFTPSNGVQVALGQESNADGDLAPGETRVVFGVDGGKPFCSGGQTGGIAASGSTDGTFGFMSVCHDPHDPLRAYAGSKGWSASYLEGSVFLTTTDGGYTWHAPETNPKGMKIGSLEDILSPEAMKSVERRGGLRRRSGTGPDAGGR